MPRSATVRQLQCAALFMSEGYAPSGACAMVGNYSQESGPNLPTVFRTSHLDHGSNGLAQWRLGRLEGYKAFVRAKHPDADDDELWDQYGRIDYQVAYSAVELRRDYSGLDRALRRGGSVSALVARVCWEFERPNRAAANLPNRVEQGLITFRAIPEGAKTATKQNVIAHLDNIADEHAAQKQAAAVGAGGATSVLAATGLVHLAPHLHWYEWAIIVMMGFCLIACIVSWFQNHKSEGLVRAARTNMTVDTNTTVPERAVPDQGSTPTQPDTAVVSPEKQRQFRRDRAKQDEQAAIDKAMGRKTHASEDKAQPARDPSQKPTPIGQVVTSEQKS